MQIAPQQFQKMLLKWFDQHGRNHLPWQQCKTPYRVWVSEIMLQQTQVNTVLPYFERFMRTFPDLITLAKADEDEVLHLWAGLGYYSRARNLHRAAKIVVDHYHGQFPNRLAELVTLPGIGLSTAGAILAIAFNQPAAILDGNVKRVLTRLHGITELINQKPVENKLWELAHHYTPQKRVADYTQAMMDLGATVCTRGQPQCTHCPLNPHCAAHAQGIAALLPRKKAATSLPTHTATFLILKKGARILLRKRPASGIWGGLWSLPEMTGKPEKKRIKAFCKQHFATTPADLQTLEPIRHTFSHYHLDIFPIVITFKNANLALAGATDELPHLWYDPHQPDAVGLPKPVQHIMRAFL